MDLLSLGIILLILVASGGIAFVADGLGKKIGKKRISVFGLRPKHVASLGTVLMGVLVSMLTIGFIAAVSRDAREWLKEGRGLLVQRDELRKNVELQKAQLGDLNSTIRLSQVEIKNQKAEIDRGNGRILELDGSLREKDGALRAKNAALQEKNAKLQLGQLAINRLQLQLPRLHEQVASAQEQVRSINTRLALVRKDLLVAQADLATALHNKQVAVVNSNAALKKSIETYAENERLLAEVTTREELNAKLKAEAEGLVAQRDDAQAQAEAAQARYAQVRDQLEGLDKELIQMNEALQTQATFLNGGFKTSRTEAMTFRRGEEVARIVVPAASDVETSRARLDSLLRVARINAVARGAKGHRSQGQTFEAADVVDRKDPKTGAVADADTLKRSLVASLAGGKEDQVLVATSSLNAFTGEPVSLELATLPNPVAYHRNETVAEDRIDGSQSEDRILAQLSAFMNGKLRRAAQDRMIPRVGTSAPFGEPSAAEVWNVLQKVRKAGRSVRVQAVAGDDLRAADLLRVEFRVH